MPVAHSYNRGLPMPPYEITLFDDAPYVLDTTDVGMLGDTVDVPNTPLLPLSGKRGARATSEDRPGEPPDLMESLRETADI